MQITRSQFLTLATLFQGTLALSALGIGWLIGTNQAIQMEITIHTLLISLTATVPMLLVFAVTYQFPVGPLKTIKQFLLEALGPALAECRWYDLAWVALLAGTSEELLFRGVIQTWLRPSGPLLALIISNLVFGLAHAVTPTYAILAGVMGVYLGTIYELTGDHNLVVPIMVHSFYDLAAFFVVRHTHLRSSSKSLNPLVE